MAEEGGAGRGGEKVRPRGTLLRVLGVGFGIAVTVGGTIGVGILRTPGMVAAHLGDPGLILLVWGIGGVYALLGVLSVCELGTSWPRAGGWYVYARRAFGDYGGFAVGWCDFIAQCAAVAYLAVGIGEFAAALAPLFRGQVLWIAGGVLLLFVGVQMRGIRTGSRVQEWTSGIKALAFLLLIGACFALGEQQAPSEVVREANPEGFARPLGPSWGSLILALQAVIVTYDGWYSAIYFVEEDRDPARNLPRAALGGVLCTIGIYLLMNGALFSVLPLSQLAASSFPAGEAAAVIFGSQGERLITILSLLSLLSILNAVLLLATRILFALSRDGLLPVRMAEVNAGGTPHIALALSALVGMLLIVTGTFEQLIALASFFYAVVYASGFLSLFVLRWREPAHPRPFRTWGYPWTPLIALVGSLVFLIGAVFSDPMNARRAAWGIALSYPAYRLFRAGCHKRR